MAQVFYLVLSQKRDEIEVISVQDTLTEQTHDDMQAARQRYLCPSCGKHTVLWLLPTTQIKDLPVKCKRCGKEMIINITPAL